MGVKIIPAYDVPEEVSRLFNEYTDMLITGDPAIKRYLDIQNYDEEVKHLEQKYGLPFGRLYIAYCDDKLAGCIGLRKINNQDCEMKRLFVRPEYRGRHIGDQLVQQIIADAGEIGYRHILLDTLPFLKSAVRIYKKYGFYEIEKYNNSPMGTSIYMRLDL